MIDKIDFGLKSIKPIIPEQPKIQGPEGQDAKQGAKSFAEVFQSALKETNELQNVADKKVEELTLGKPGVTQHDAVIALEKADVAFQLMTKIQAKIIRAYEEVMRTAV